MVAMLMLLGGCAGAVPASDPEGDAQTVCTGTEARAMLVEQCGPVPSPRSTIAISTENGRTWMTSDSFESFIDWVWAIDEYRNCTEGR